MPNHHQLFNNPRSISVAIILPLIFCLSLTLQVVRPQTDESIKVSSNTPPEPTEPSALKELRASEALDSIRNWAIRIGRDIFHGTQEASCFRMLHDQFDPAKQDSNRRGPYRASVISNDWTSMHADIVRTISSTMGWHKSAVEAIARASESLAKNHTFVESLRFDYVDVHRLRDLSELPGASGDLADQLEPSLDYSSETSNLGSSMGGQLLPPANTDTGEQATATSEPTQPTEELGTPAALVMILQSDRNYSTALGTSDVEWQTPVRYSKLERHEASFGDVPVSTEDSAVHVPVHIFPGDPLVMNGIAWSDGLTKVFRDNYVRNPKLSNQYFASQTGFMRLFPAQRWQIPRTDPDLYDARMRPWYVAGASSRKEVIILVDSSGSMTGSRRDIAKGVVFEILDTLTDNDNFLVLKFSDTVQQVGVPPCEKMRLKRRRGANIPLKNQLYHSTEGAPTTTPESRAPAADSSSSDNKSKASATDVDSLYFLPANGRNVRHVKTGFNINTSGIANFSHALVTAFEVLLKYQDSKQLGAQCNQAIMLITDGSPSDFDDIFSRYNYPNAPVRVFTYLIGRETGDGSHTKMIACHNRGYYTHVINLAEVRETVQQYIPVMARPLVLNRAHPITWTPAYGELTYQTLTDWTWESRRRAKARSILATKGRGSSSRAAGGQSLQDSSPPGYVPEISVASSDDSSLLGSNGPSGDPSLSTNGDDSSSFSSDSFTIGSDALERELDELDIFGYNKNPDCFWETNENDLLTTVVQPVHDLKNESKVVERFLNKNTWVTREMLVRTASLLGVAAADMRISDIVALAPSHKLGPNGYAIMLTNNGLVMHHPDIRSILEPGFNLMSGSASDDPYQAFPSSFDKRSRILKPFFSSLDFTQLEHIVAQSQDTDFVKLRQEAVAGLTGWRELNTKRTIDCQRRVQTRRQSFYYKSLEHFPFSFLIAIPQPYGSHRLEAQVDIKSAPSTLPEKLTTYFTTSDFDVWTVHPNYEYCSGPSNNTITTLLDMFQRIQEQKLDDIQARPAESSKPPVALPGKIVYDKELVQSLVYDAVATYGFSDSCGLPGSGGESSFLNMFGVRFSFVSTRSGLTRVRHFVDDTTIKKEALAFVRRHRRGPDETFYKRTVDFNMLINETATLVQVPFNMHQKILARLARYDMDQLDRLSSEGEPLDSTESTAASSDGIDLGTEAIGPPTRRVHEMDLYEKMDILVNKSLHVIATQSIIVNEGNQRAVAGVTGVFYDYAQFVQRLLNTTNLSFSERRASSMGEGDSASRVVRCGHLNDTIDCLLIDNNGYILVTEELEFVGRHLSAYDPVIMGRLVTAGVYRELNITDYQSICLDSSGEKQTTASSSCTRLAHTITQDIFSNLFKSISHLWSLTLTLSGFLCDLASAAHQMQSQPLPQPSMQSLIPNKTYLRPCERILTRYETSPGLYNSEVPEYYKTQCDCAAWFVYEQVSQTNLILLVVDNNAPNCRYKCDQVEQRRQQQQNQLNNQFNIIGQDDKQVCSMIEREAKLYKKSLDSCYSHHPDEEHIRLCGSAVISARVSNSLIIFLLLICSNLALTWNRQLRE